MTVTPTTEFAEVDLGSLDFWGQPAEERDRYFEQLRRGAPISRHEPPEDILGLPDQGRMHYWAIVRYEDIRRISRDPATFCSGEGVQFADAPPEMLEASQSFLAMDAPRHTQAARPRLLGLHAAPGGADRGRDPGQRAADHRRGGAHRRRRLRRADRQAAAAADDLGHARRAARPTASG